MKMHSRSAALVARPMFIVTLIIVSLFGLFSATAWGELPKLAESHRGTLTRAARLSFGLDAPVATLAAQVHQESLWQADAQSSAGAEGIAQFMPGTSAWMASLYPSSLGGPQPYNPAWALRAMAKYDLWLFNRVSAETICDRWAMVLSAYNGGLGWVYRDKELALASGASLPLNWNEIETYNAGRSASNFKQNRHYVRVILTNWEPLYMRHGWGSGVCRGAVL